MYFRQSSSVREELIKNFFNDDDKKFIEGKDKWALSADTEFEFIYFGYFWGVFLPAFDSVSYTHLTLPTILLV